MKLRYCFVLPEILDLGRWVFLLFSDSSVLVVSFYLTLLNGPIRFVSKINDVGALVFRGFRVMVS